MYVPADGTDCAATDALSRELVWNVNHRHGALLCLAVRSSNGNDYERKAVDTAAIGIRHARNP